MNAINKEFVKQCFGDVSFIPEKFAEDFVMEVFVLQRFPVVNVSLSKKKIKDFPFIIYYNV